MKVDFKSLKPIKMNDPIRYPKVIEPLEKQMKQSYDLELNKMLVDITHKLTRFKTKI